MANYAELSGFVDIGFKWEYKGGRKLNHAT